MSADGHTVCPKCHPDLLTYTDHNGVIDCSAEDLGYERDVRENYEFSFKADDGQIVLVVDYRADCWECGWHYELQTSDFPVTA